MKDFNRNFTGSFSNSNNSNNTKKIEKNHFDILLKKDSWVEYFNENKNKKSVFEERENFVLKMFNFKHEIPLISTNEEIRKIICSKKFTEFFVNHNSSEEKNNDSIEVSFFSSFGSLKENLNILLIKEKDSKNAIEYKISGIDNTIEGYIKFNIGYRGNRNLLSMEMYMKSEGIKSAVLNPFIERYVPENVMKVLNTIKNRL